MVILGSTSKINFSTTVTRGKMDFFFFFRGMWLVVEFLVRSVESDPVTNTKPLKHAWELTGRNEAWTRVCFRLSPSCRLFCRRETNTPSPFSALHPWLYSRVLFEIKPSESPWQHLRDRLRATLSMASRFFTISEWTQHTLIKRIIIIITTTTVFIQHIKYHYVLDSGGGWQERDVF